MRRQFFRLLRLGHPFKIFRTREEIPLRLRERMLHQIGILKLPCVASDRQIETFSEDIHHPVSRRFDDSYFGVIREKGRQHMAQCELRNLGGHRDADHAARLSKTLTHRLFSILRASQQGYGVLVKLLAHLGHGELA